MANFRERVFGYRSKKKETEDLQPVLERIPIFKDLSRREFSSIERILHRRDYVPEEIIIRQGEPGLGMYIIQTGTARVVSEPAGVQLSTLSDGDFFGEVSLLDESPRSATVVSTTHSRVLAFFQSDLFSLIERDPRLGVKIVIRLAKFIGERLKKVNQHVLDLTEQVKQLEQQKPARRASHARQ